MKAFALCFTLLFALFEDAFLVRAQQDTHSPARNALPSYQLKNGILEVIDKDDTTAVPIERDRVTVVHLTHSADPGYPRGEWGNGICVISAVVGLDGKPDTLLVKKFFKPAFDERALGAVRKFRFKPATLDGKPVPMQINIEMSFHFSP